MSPDERVTVGRPNILSYFQYGHLPINLQSVSKQFADLAIDIWERNPGHPETENALRKLLEAKDCAVRASL